MKSKASESELFRLLLNGDEKVLADLHNLHGDPIYLYAFRFLKDAKEAEDVTARSFYALWTQRQDLESYRHIKNFLFHVTRNACINVLRRKRRERVIMQDVGIVKDMYGEPDRADFRLIRSELFSIIFDEVKNIRNEKMREVFVLRFIEHKSPREISDMMEIDIKIVYNYAQVAKTLIKSALLKRGLDASYLFVLALLSMCCLVAPQL